MCLYVTICLQCFDAVGWPAGKRAVKLVCVCVCVCYMSLYLQNYGGCLEGRGGILSELYTKRAISGIMKWNNKNYKKSSVAYLQFQTATAPSPPTDSICAMVVVWRVEGEYCQNCCVVCCVRQLCTAICTQM